MKTFKQYLAETTAAPVSVTKEPTDGQWFRHQSPDWYATLKPISYNALRSARTEYPVDDRVKHEDNYRELVDHPKSRSFLYATMVGFNKMESAKSYPGFTYYFRLSSDQISRCIFDITDNKKWMNPTKGITGLGLAKDLWVKNSADFESYDDPEIGSIDPRIEIIIPFEVHPELFYPQVEDR